MSTLIDFSDVKSYATRENAIKAFNKSFGATDVRFVVVQNADGRFSPVGLGERAVQLGVHFKFPVAG